MGAVLILVGISLAVSGLVFSQSAHADEVGSTTCTPSDVWTETVTDSPAWDEQVFDHWQRYSWTGGPHAEDDPPAFPSSDWQPNVQGDPHGIGHAGPYFRSNGNSGNGDWFYLEVVQTTVHHDAVTHEIVHDAVTCPTETTSAPTESTSIPTATTSVPTESTSIPTATVTPTLPTESNSQPTTPSSTPTVASPTYSWPTEIVTETLATPTHQATELAHQPFGHYSGHPTDHVATSGTLPNTGGVNKGWLWFGAGLLILGLTLTLIAGRKRS